VRTIAFREYLSPDYETGGKVIPAVGTLNVPAVQKMNEVFFDLFLPAGSAPPHGWPTALVGHGLTGSKNSGTAPLGIAAKLAQHGIATIAINAVGHGGGPLGTLTINRASGEPITLPAGGRAQGARRPARRCRPPGCLPSAYGPVAVLARAVAT
jgi:hypothetical protein